jgi:hypothetical protein
VRDAVHAIERHPLRHVLAPAVPEEAAFVGLDVVAEVQVNVITPVSEALSRLEELHHHAGHGRCVERDTPKDWPLRSEWFTLQPT